MCRDTRMFINHIYCHRYVLAADPPAHRSFSLRSIASMLIFRFCLNSLPTAIMKCAVLRNYDGRHIP
jgi:hypothetical protein